MNTSSKRLTGTDLFGNAKRNPDDNYGDADWTESDFSEPIGILEDCHKRIPYFLGIWATLPESVGTASLSVDERDSLERALGYFREPDPRHNADEEESLFPELRRHSETINIIEDLAALEADHHWAESQHLEVDAIGRRCLSADVLYLRDRARRHVLTEPLLHFSRVISISRKKKFSLRQGAYFLPWKRRKWAMKWRERRAS